MFGQSGHSTMENFYHGELLAVFMYFLNMKELAGGFNKVNAFFSGHCQISRSPVDSSTLQKSSDGLCCILCPVTSGTISVAGSVDSPHVRTQELTNDLSISRQSPHYMEIYRLLGSAA